MSYIDKYFHKMENIRLAERLLVVKPSAELRRGSQKKFYLQQQNYSSRISRSPNNPKSQGYKKMNNPKSKWI